MSRATGSVARSEGCSTERRHAANPPRRLAPARALQTLHASSRPRYNLFNQVGLIAVNMLGEKDSVVGMDGPQTRAALSGVPGAASRPSNRPSAMDDLAFDMNFDARTAARIRAVMTAKEEAVRTEQYERAKQLKQLKQRLKRRKRRRPVEKWSGW